MIDNEKYKRRFSYEPDIKPHLDFEAFELKSDQIKIIATSLSEENKDRKSFAITLDALSKTFFREESLGTAGNAQVSIEYITRRYSEIIENPFLSRICAQRHLEIVK